jgi:hypothetical protein
MKVKIIVSSTISRYHGLFWTLEFEIEGGKGQKYISLTILIKVNVFSNWPDCKCFRFPTLQLEMQRGNSFSGHEILFIFLVNLGDPYKIYIVKMTFFKDASLTSVRKDYSCHSLRETQHLSSQLSTWNDNLNFRTPGDPSEIYAIKMRCCEDTVRFGSQKKSFLRPLGSRAQRILIFRLKLVFRTFHQNTYIWRQLGHYVRWTLHNYGMKVKIIVSSAISRYHGLFWTLEFEIEGGKGQKNISLTILIKANVFSNWPDCKCFRFPTLQLEMQREK